MLTLSRVGRCAAALIVATLAVTGCHAGPVSQEGRPYLGGPGDAIVASLAEGGTALRLQLATASGDVRELSDLVLPSVDGVATRVRSVAVGELGHALVATESPEDSHHLDLYDLAQPSTPVTRLADSWAWHAFGPDDLLVVARDEEQRQLDVFRIVLDGSEPVDKVADVTVPDGVMVAGWRADGQGFDTVGHGSGPGSLTLAGELSSADPDPDPYLATGLERLTGPGGSTLTMAHGDGFDESGGIGWYSMSIASTSGQAWYSARSDLDQPMPEGVAWDPAGDSLWLLLAAGDQLQVARLMTPGEPTIVATLPASVAPDEESPAETLVGIAPDGSAVALGWPEPAEGGKTRIVDTATGTVRTFDGTFVRWSP